MRRHCRGEAYWYRFADDFVACCQYQTDADDFLERLGKRMEEFHLELAPEKTRHLAVGRYARAHAYRRGEKPQEFTHSIGFSGGQLSSYVEGRSALDFPLVHDARSPEQP